MRKQSENVGANAERDNIVFSGSIVFQNGRYALMLRAFVYEKSKISKIISDIIKKKEYKFNGILIFRNPAMAILRLKELGLI